ncbi:hypothetical protein [Arenimonas alkanexedens]
MAVENVKSAAITTADAAPPLPNQVPMRLANARVRESIGRAAIPASASIGSIARVLRIKSSDRVGALLLSCTALTGAAADVGLYDIPTVNAGAVVDVDLFASAQSIATALANTDVLRESGTITVARLEEPVWQLLGLTADPGKQYDIALTFTAATTPAGDVALRAQFVSND